MIEPLNPFVAPNQSGLVIDPEIASQLLTNVPMTRLQFFTDIQKIGETFDEIIELAVRCEKLQHASVLLSNRLKRISDMQRNPSSRVTTQRRKLIECISDISESGYPCGLVSKVLNNIKASLMLQTGSQLRATFESLLYLHLSIFHPTVAGRKQEIEWTSDQLAIVKVELVAMRQVSAMDVNDLTQLVRIQNSSQVETYKKRKYQELLPSTA